MAATADSSRRTAFSPRAEDLIAPQSDRRVRHFRPVLSGGGIIDAEYEEIAAGEEASATPPVPKVRNPARFDSGAGRLNFFGRSVKLTTAASKGGGFATFAVATVVLSFLSFWVSGGHAAVSGLFADRQANNVAPVQSVALEDR